ncbi:mucin-2-like [Musca vetustissima]|uniref:mucin-2-like n=1 Tax=Musca vetustissima TaxID=27455 RepID=UPI002AB7593A|nr:mucin-2-like [Musca vetustissima]
MTALLAEYTEKPYGGVDFGDDFEDFNQGKKRRQDTNEVHAGLCQSIVRYARPQKARSASGEWKFIVNTGKHTQTLRLEKCTNPQETCSYLSSTYKSYCSQVYNYHRLLSWDKTRGLHVDIFKVPTCCSCQINGMRQQQFAAALGTFTKKDFTPVAPKPQEPYRTESFDYTEDDEAEEDDDDLAFNIRNYHHYKHDTSFDANELLSGGSNKVKTKLPSPTVGSYLSPPDNDEFGQYPYKLNRDSSKIFKPSAPGPSQQSLSSSASSSAASNKILRDLARRRPHKSFSNDYQTDLEYSPSEQHAEREVNHYGKLNGKLDRSQQTKTKPLYSVIHTGGNNDSTTAITSSTGTIRAHTPETLHNVPSTGQPRPDTNAHQKSPAIRDTSSSNSTPDSIPTEVTGNGAALFESSVSTHAPTPPTVIRTASLPTHYYTHASGGRLKSKPRLRIPGTKASSSTPASSTIAETTEYTETSSKRKVVPSITSDVFRNTYKAKLNLTSYYSPTAATTSNAGDGASTKFSSSNPPPKRINYSYHPIIDFFEYNRKIQTSTGGATTATTPVTPKPSSTGATRRTRITTKPPYHLSSTQLYSHKIPNAVPSTIYQQPQTPVQQNDHEQQQLHKHSRQQNERRIGYGAAGDGSSVTSHSSRFFPNNEPTADAVYPSVRRHLDTEDTDVWHPVIVENI